MASCPLLLLGILSLIPHLASEAAAQTNPNPPSPTDTSTPGNIVVFGQSGVLQSGSSGFNVVIPDSSGGLRSVPLDQLGQVTPAPQTGSAPNANLNQINPNPISPNPPPGITTPEAASDAARAAGVGTGTVQSPQLGGAQNPFVCECRCPPCPSPAPDSLAARNAAREEERRETGRSNEPGPEPLPTDNQNRDQAQPLNQNQEAGRVPDPRADESLRDFYGPLPLPRRNP
ncbi:MAG: hypothetical protein A2Z97_16580 [Bdellovibrionales bacterium GWB1_52_6]|nr:MAG: hypothetical protein A2Z97_16580 [Bdellovibrionales bacterium GWB1_52_6]OFZ05085.1 MAG: hypothetical protein A2X97_00650 [Bdellovibrionales bacterium GWA1_52_35]HCM41324.1 hypothetical protein [Bdellovibrionales bacterium]